MPTLRLPNGEALMHGDSLYDPVKAHEYYLKTRQLKGRKKGSGLVPITSGRSRKTKGSGSVTVTFNGMQYKLTPAQHAEQQAYAAERVRNIKIKIHTLEKALKEKMAKARKTEREAKKPKTAAEKRAAAKRSAEYKAKHKQKVRTAAKKAAKKQTKHNLNTVEGLKSAISNAQAKLTEAVDRQRALATATSTARRR